MCSSIKLNFKINYQSNILYKIIWWIITIGNYHIFITSVLQFFPLGYYLSVFINFSFVLQNPRSITHPILEMLFLTANLASQSSTLKFKRTSKKELTFFILTFLCVVTKILSEEKKKFIAISICAWLFYFNFTVSHSIVSYHRKSFICIICVANVIHKTS